VRFLRNTNVDQIGGEKMSNHLSTTLSKENLFQQLKNLAEVLSLRDGFKLIYDRWDRITTSNVVFLSLNPGRAPNGANLEEVSDERGNTYVVELDISKSPINRQFIDLFDLLGVDLDTVLAGVYIPFRSNRLKDLSQEQKQQALQFSRQFWLPLVKSKDLTICCGIDVFNEVHKQLFPDNFVEVIPSGWGNTSIKRILLPNEKIIIGLPHLSTFRLLSVDRCRDVLTNIIKK
jgi:hypothetical protein